MEAELITSVSPVANYVADFWMGHMLIDGMPYHRRDHPGYREKRQELRVLLRRAVEDRLYGMLGRDTGEQWIINHISSPYPLFQRFLRESAISGASWSQKAAMSIVYRDGVFDIRIRKFHHGYSVERLRQYELA